MARGSSKPLEYVDNYKKICCKKRFSKKILVYLLIDQNVCNFTKFWTTEGLKKILFCFLFSFIRAKVPLVF